MALSKPIRRIAVVGTGVIGASWAAQYLARGFEVIATDPGLNAEANLRKYVDGAWPALTTVGLTPGASRDRLSFTADMKKAVAQADFVQENAPERPDFKIKLFADMDDAAPVDSIIASSSSGITPTVMQTQCKHPERVLVGHPFNPPHIIPLVEVVGGTRTSSEAVQRAIEFYDSIGKKTIRLNKEVTGHVANRLQAALYREVVYLIEQGVLNVVDADTAVSWGPGLRWGVMGQSLLWHLGGGEGGIRHFMDHLMGPLEAMWAALGTPAVTPDLKQAIVDGVLQETAGRSFDQLAAERDEVLLGLLALRHRTESGRTGQHSNGAAERVFFLDVSGGRMASVTTDGQDVKVLIDGLKRLPDGIVVDAAAGHIYWTNMGTPTNNDGSIERADLDGGNRRTIVAEGATFTPKQLQLDAKGGKLYWCDREGMRVMSANRDGSAIETLVDTSQGDARPGRDARKWCVGIAIDHERGQLYWTQKGPDNAGEGRILRANLTLPTGETAATRSDIEVLFDGLPEPIDLDLDLDNRLIYWTDRGDAPRGNTVSRAHLDASPGNGHGPEILVDGLMEGIGLALDLKGRRMFFSDLGGSVYSAKLDGSDKKALTFAAGNLTGVAYAGLD